jgi:DNA-binding XRE family transcriptional regulator
MGTTEAVRLALVRLKVADGTAQATRERAGLSRGDVGGTVGVDPSTIFRWETGLRTPRGSAALRYGELLDALERTLAERAAAS